VVILGVLAAIVLPQVSTATASARASMLMDDLRIMRSQLMVFKAQHNGVSAGYPDGNPAQNPTEAALALQLTLSSTVSGQTAAVGTPGYPYGPYMREMPENPINAKRSVRIIPDGTDFPDTPTNQDGWIYQPSTLLFKADSPGTDEEGRPFFEY